MHEQIDEVSEKIKDSPNEISLFIRRGRLYLEDEQLRRAKHDFKKVLSIGNINHFPVEALDAYYYLGEIALKQNKNTTAIRNANIFITQLPAESGAHMRGLHLQGRAYFAARKYEQAASSFQDTIDAAVFPKPEYYLDLAKTYQALKQPESAVAALQQGKQKRGDLSVFDDAIIEIYLTQKNFKEAIFQLDEIIARKQRLPFLYLKKSEVLMLSGEPEQAKQALLNAQQILNRLPKSRRTTPALLKLKEAIEQRLTSSEFK